MEIVRNIFIKLLNPRVKKSFNLRKSTIVCLEDLSKYLDEICAREIKKNYSENIPYVAGVIFRDNKIFKTKNEFEQYCRCNLFLANEWLKFLIHENIKVNGKASHKRVVKFKDHIHDFLHDVKPFVEYFERKRDSEFVFFTGSKYYGQLAWQIYRESCGLYWQSTQNSGTCSHTMTINLSIFSLRQALEIKFQRIVGIYRIHNKKYEEPKVKHDFYVRFVEKHLSKIKTNYSTLNNLIKVYQWTNNTIHTGFMPFIWVQWYALELCDPLSQL